jgi:hypothetical protein
LSTGHTLQMICCCCSSVGDGQPVLLVGK